MEKGIVIKSTGSWYKVLLENKQVINCRIKGKFRLQELKSTNPVAVGDIVDISYGEDGENGIIEEIKDRKNYIVRKSTNLSKQSHVIAANIDHAFLVISTKKPRTLRFFADRFLVSAEAYRIPTSLVFNKIDLLKGSDLDDLEEWLAIYTLAGYKCYTCSAVTGENINIIENLLKDKICLFAGNSGVGKSSIINTIDPSYQLKTAQISKSVNKGKHTTTYAEMLELKNGGYIIDTPGIKAFGLLDMEKEKISHYFPEMFKLLPHCQYSNCTHTHEPSCKVKDGLGEGLVSYSRYESYLSMINDQNDKHRQGF